MKLLCLLFSMFVLILSVRPCCADQNCETTNAPLTEQGKGHTSPEKECQGCSPFFTCGSCVGFIVAKPVPYAINLIADQPVRSYAPYRQLYPKDVVQAILRPPQLS